MSQLAPSRLVNQSKEVRYFTPGCYIESARKVLGGIDLDPASEAAANETVRAARYYTVEDDGLAQPWKGRVWLNPPWKGSIAVKFARKLQACLDDGSVSAAIVCVNSNATTTKWFHETLWDGLACFPDHRPNFLRHDKEDASPVSGAVFVYFGPKPGKFRDEFAKYGRVAKPYKNTECYTEKCNKTARRKGLCDACYMRARRAAA